MDDAPTLAREAPMTTPRRSLWPLWAMIAVFAAPVVATWFYFFFPEYLPDSRSNRGEILNPPIDLPADLDLVGPDGAPFDPAVLEGAWTLVYLAGGGCDQTCMGRLIELRQIRLGLGEGRKLVERLLIVADPQRPLDSAILAAAFEGMHLARLDSSATASLLDVLGEGTAGLDRVYLLDPFAKVMMRYRVDDPPEATLNDMERLIKGSKNWIKGAGYGHN